jgi:hypothetical protein
MASLPYPQPVQQQQQQKQSNYLTMLTRSTRLPHSDASPFFEDSNKDSPLSDFLSTPAPSPTARCRDD